MKPFKRPSDHDSIGPLTSMSCWRTLTMLKMRILIMRSKSRLHKQIHAPVRGPLRPRECRQEIQIDNGISENAKLLINRNKIVIFIL